MYCTRSYFYPWSVLETKITKHIEVKPTGYGTDCWLYQGSLDCDGYGRVKIQSIYIKVHRLMWLARFGLIPEDLVVCHKCDQPACCRPEHLRLDTNPENIRERTRKGRTAKGSQQGASKLTEELVIKMRQDYASVKNCAELGRKFGVHRQTARRIINREGWTHVP